MRGGDGDTIKITVIDTLVHAGLTNRGGGMKRRTILHTHVCTELKHAMETAGADTGFWKGGDPGNC